MADDDDKKGSDDKHEIKQIISIDFGSFGSQAAFCLPSSPSKFIVCKSWKGMDKCDTAMAKKTLTALLWDKKKENVKAFGYHAYQLYSDYIGLKNDIIRLQKQLNVKRAKLTDTKIKLSDTDKKRIEKQIKRFKKSIEKKEKEYEKFCDDDLVYFEHFKPHLMGHDSLMKDKYIKSTDGSTELSILKLIEMSLIEIKRRAMNEADIIRKDRKLDLHPADLKEDEILWALSTPSVWDDTSRGAFKECVINAKMRNHVIGLEPEFALFCMSKTDMADFLEIDKKYIVLDAGGGTTDATCIEINDGSELTEVVARAGMELGSLMIDEEYYKMLNGIFGKAFMDTFKREQPHKWNVLKTNFWKAKHLVDPITFKDTGCNVEIPPAFWKTLKERFDAEDDAKESNFDDYVNRLCTSHSDTSFGDKKYIEYDEEGDSLIIDINLWHIFHRKLLDEICNFLKNLLSEDDMSDCQDIILVGGLGQSKFLQTKLKEVLSDGVDEYDSRKISINPAPRPSWAVVIGGLYWAYNRDNYTRKMWLTYGFEVETEWNPNCDDETNKYPSMNSSTGYVRKRVFDPITFKNDTFDEGDQVKREYMIPFSAGNLELTIFAVNNENGADYTDEVDDDGNRICKVAAKYLLPLKDNNWVKAQQERLPITIEFQETMLEIMITQPWDKRQYPMTIKNPKLKKK